MNKYLSSLLIAIVFFCDTLEAQEVKCRRGDMVRITNGVEIKVAECRVATRLNREEGWWAYSI